MKGANDRSPSLNLAMHVVPSEGTTLRIAAPALGTVKVAVVVDVQVRLAIANVDVDNFGLRLADLVISVILQAGWWLAPSSTLELTRFDQSSARFDRPPLDLTIVSGTAAGTSSPRPYYHTINPVGVASSTQQHEQHDSTFATMDSGTYRKREHFVGTITAITQRKHWDAAEIIAQERASTLVRRAAADQLIRSFCDKVYIPEVLGNTCITAADIPSSPPRHDVSKDRQFWKMLATFVIHRLRESLVNDD
ncbi:hypothetical protein PANT_8c00084 [Moesziomyces antarcticus T-34]|uniref:Uncharacterized protein n=1 Tax=Pseudozyma antarctica (strain T-34) TaxID=1151754 RepID=M9M052_PSEA3|nr:hypothetical protein PANT_8c00084 [Moesziomyces antarcticus T-34]